LNKTAVVLWQRPSMAYSAANPDSSQNPDRTPENFPKRGDFTNLALKIESGF